MVMKKFNAYPQKFYDLVILDLHMPISDGYETCLNIRELYNKQKIFSHEEKMMPFIQKYGAHGVFLMSCYPNLTFDACGIVCGLINLPFWKFFGATAAGKTLVKAPAQVLFVVCVSKGLMRSTSFPVVPLSIMHLFQVVSIAFLLYFGGLCVHDMARKEKEYKCDKKE